MTDVIPNELVRNSIDVIEEKKPIKDAWQKSAVFMDSLITELSERTDFSSLKDVDINYNLPFDEALEQYPKQAVAVIALNQPTWAKTWAGCIDPESSLIVARRSANRWGGQTWAVPMGKVEAGDISTKNEALGDVIGDAAERELREETVRDQATNERSLIASSFLD